jgi:hypothetical protein
MSDTPQEPKAITMTIVIVGALRPDADIHPHLSALMGQIQVALFKTFPDFLPANPPVTIITADVRDDWIKRE